MAAALALNVAWPSSAEKRRGYGMHLRRARNAGRHPIRLTVGGGVVWNAVEIAPGETKLFRHDLRRIHCPEPPADAGARAVP